MVKDKLTWSEEAPPTEGISYYTHIISEITPLGVFLIEWKSWKERPDYSIVLDDNYIDTVYSLEEAKKIAFDYLITKNKELTEFLNKLTGTTL